MSISGTSTPVSAVSAPQSTPKGPDGGITSYSYDSARATFDQVKRLRVPVAHRPETHLAYEGSGRWKVRTERPASRLPTLIAEWIDVLEERMSTMLPEGLALRMEETDG